MSRLIVSFPKLSNMELSVTSAPVLSHPDMPYVAPWWRIRALGWMLVLFAGSVLVYAGVRYGTLITIDAIVGRRWTSADEGSAGAQLIATSLASVTLLLAYAGAIRKGEDRPVSELGLTHCPRELTVGLLVGGLVMAVSISTQWSGGAVTIDRVPSRSVLDALTGSIRSGVLEETLLRLCVFRLLWHVSNAWGALALSALLFGGIHLLNPNSDIFAATCIAFEAGIMLAAFYILTGRVWMSIGVHAGWNFTQGWVFGAPVSGTQDFSGGPLVTKAVAGVPSWLSGGEFGPEASLYTLLICSSLGVAVLGIAWFRGDMRAIELAAHVCASTTRATDRGTRRLS